MSKGMHARFCLAWIGLLAAVVSGCIQPGPAGSTGQDAPRVLPEPAPRTFAPIDPTKALFWDRQTTETANLLRDIIADYNTPRKGMPVEAEYIGGYSDINRKVAASIQAGALPAMAVGYESMTTEYVLAGAVANLDPLVHAPGSGLSDDELADFFPAVLETNRYPQFGGKMYSFPFAKSVLVMYFNRKVLADAGFTAPPVTWDELLQQCRAIKAKAGITPFPVNVDCSTIDGMIFSLGGDVASGNACLYDSPQSLQVFTLLETLAREGLANLITPDSYDDRVALSQGRAAFAFRSSSHKTNMELLMNGDRDSWGIAMIPQGDPANPHTVLYGPNVVVFNTTPEHRQAAWDFIRHFTSPDVSVKWALGTGYLPIRKSTATNPAIQAFWNEWPYNRTAFDALAVARSEPNLAGWQKVRDLVESAETAVLTGIKSAADATRELKQAADAVLRQAADAAAGAR